MMSYRALPFIALLFFVSCRQNSNTKPLATLQDSAIALYIKNQDLLFESKTNFFCHDANESEYLFLKAIYEKDTSYLRGIISTKRRQSIDTALANFWDNNIPNLKTLRCTEAYQFDYSETFCNLAYVITVYKIDDSIRLSSIVIRRISTDENYRTKLEVYHKEEKNLSLEAWGECIRALEFSDYWNLKNSDNKCVLDPSILSVKGIKEYLKTG